MRWSRVSPQPLEPVVHTAAFYVIISERATPELTTAAVAGANSIDVATLAVRATTPTARSAR